MTPSTDLVTVKNVSCFSVQEINVSGAVTVENLSAAICIVDAGRRGPGISSSVFPLGFACFLSRHARTPSDWPPVRATVT
mgnify:CR=1 FL=1